MHQSSPPPISRAEQCQNLRAAQNARTPLTALIIGGGINGAVSALCLAQHKLNVALSDAGDFAGVTSQASSNLIWGGIKYLENFEFTLVRELSAARNQLLRAYPNLVRELRFLAPHQKGDRHSLLKLYLGSWFYWGWGGFKTRPPRLYTRAALKTTHFPLNFKQLTGGFEYSDAYLIENDARFVFHFIRAAAASGAHTLNYMPLVQAHYHSRNQLWETQLYDRVTGRTLNVYAKILINAAGPALDSLNTQLQQVTRHHHIFSKGIHLIVRRLLPVRRALAFYANDGRLFFVLPMGHCSCIGTTDTRVKTPYTKVTPADRQFILTNINALLALKPALSLKDIIAERCGVRPLAQLRTHTVSSTTDWASLSRKHILESDPNKRLLSIFGGKLTACLNVGKEVYAAIRPWLDTQSPMELKADWFGETPSNVQQTFNRRAQRILSVAASTRLWRRYGEQAYIMLERLEQVHKQAGQTFIAGPSSNPKTRAQKKAQKEWEKLTALIDPAGDVMVIELLYAVEHEQVVTLEDLLRRRTMLALTTPANILKRHPILQSLARKLKTPTPGPTALHRQYKPSSRSAQTQKYKHANHTQTKKAPKTLKKKTRTETL